MQILENYPKCILCGSLRLNLLNKQVFFHNFYTKSIKNDLALSEKILKNENSSVYELLYSSKFTMVFKKNIFKIFNQIYGQHNRNWQNVINFLIKV